MRKHTRTLRFHFLKTFPYIPLPFACKGGGGRGGVVKLKFPQKYLTGMCILFGFILFCAADGEKMRQV